MMKKSMVLMTVLALALIANFLLAPKVAAQSAIESKVFSDLATGCWEEILQGPPVSTEELLQKADVVFSGEVVAVEPVNVIPIPEHLTPSDALRHKRALATFDVEEEWKGVLEEPVVVLGEAFVDRPCEEPEERFHEGDRLLVLAKTREEDVVPDQPNAQLPGGRDPADYPVRDGKEEFDKEIPLGTMDLFVVKPLDEAEAELLVLRSAERAEPDSADPTSVSYTRTDVANIAIVASGALLFVGTLGALTLWRWRRLTDSAPDNTRR